MLRRASLNDYFEVYSRQRPSNNDFPLSAAVGPRIAAVAGQLVDGAQDFYQGIWSVSVTFKFPKIALRAPLPPLS